MNYSVMIHQCIETANLIRSHKSFIASVKPKPQKNIPEKMFVCDPYTSKFPVTP